MWGVAVGVCLKAELGAGMVDHGRAYYWGMLGQHVGHFCMLGV